MAEQAGPTSEPGVEQAWVERGEVHMSPQRPRSNSQFPMMWCRSGCKLLDPGITDPKARTQTYRHQLEWRGRHWQGPGAVGAVWPHEGPAGTKPGGQLHPLTPLLLPLFCSVLSHSDTHSLCRSRPTSAQHTCLQLSSYSWGRGGSPRKAAYTTGP